MGGVVKIYYSKLQSLGGSVPVRTLVIGERLHAQNVLWKSYEDLPRAITTTDVIASTSEVVVIYQP